MYNISQLIHHDKSKLVEYGLHDTWLGGVVVTASDSQSRDRAVAGTFRALDSRARQAQLPVASLRYQVTTLVKLFTPKCLCNIGARGL